MNTEDTNWHQSVTAVVIKDSKVLLARHTYGKGKGMLIIPGGYVENGETPQNAVIREFIEETNITIAPKKIIGIRFNMHDWYIAFSADYISGKEKSDNDENSEVLWMNIDKALQRNDVPDLTKKLIRCALNNCGLGQIDYDASNSPCSLYGATQL
ncbi:MAG: NUDIX hydrolase [Eubacterium sp.]|nr:NUDIX hydrolase [Eubacterium sp.]